MKQPHDKFRIHISEPRWQQVASIIVVVVIVVAELFFVLKIVKIIP